MKVILGSESKKRKILLEEAGVHVDEAISPSIDEKAIRSTDFRELTLLLARAKREALRSRISEPAFLITGDTVLNCGPELFERPQNPDDERNFFKSYDGKTHIGFHSSVTVTNLATNESREGTESGEFIMGPFSDELVEQYIKEGEYTQYAGGFTFMDPRFAENYTHLSGGTDTLMGMPTNLVKQFLSELGWQSAQ